MDQSGYELRLELEDFNEKINSFWDYYRYLPSANSTTKRYFNDMFREFESGNYNYAQILIGKLIQRLGEEKNNIYYQNVEYMFNAAIENLKYADEICNKVLELMVVDELDEKTQLQKQRQETNKQTKKYKIFISHSSIDSQIGEKFLDVLDDLGINKNNIFYSSKYHTGVQVGKDFHKVIKKALQESEVVIFLLTKNFYKSAACLNEMGASWIMEKEIIPVLLDGLTVHDMQGFIDSHYIAYIPNKDNDFKLKSVLTPYIDKDSTENAAAVFESFISETNKASKNVVQISNSEDEYSQIEKMMLSGKFTDNELILINYIYEKQLDHILDFAQFDYETGKNFVTPEYKDIQNYSKQFVNFDLQKAKNLLERSGIIGFDYIQGVGYEQPDYNGFVVNINFFRDIISLHDECRSILEKAKIKNLKPKDKVKIKKIKANDNFNNIFDSIILGDDFKEIEGLFYCFIKDTYTNSFGDRWMAEGTIREIEKWENQNNLNHKLSSNYFDVLKILKHREILEVLETTSYGNPRLYGIASNIEKQIHSLNNVSKELLNSIYKNNKYEGELPF